jgi:subtilisin-like proprotein convertase family protein
MIKIYVFYNKKKNYYLLIHFKVIFECKPKININKMLKKNLLILLFFFSFSLVAQTNNWQLRNEKELTTLSKVKRANIPKNYKLYSLDLENLKNQLINAPNDLSGQSSNITIAFPNADGEMMNFRIYNSPIMEDGLSEKFSDIKTFLGKGIDDPTATMRFSITAFGLHAMTLSGNSGAIFIDTYTSDLKNYIVYNKSNLENTKIFECGFDELNHDAISPLIQNKSTTSKTSDGNFRVYRLAMAATGEYTTFHGGTIALAQAAIVVTVNRVNTIYERDFSARLNLVANNNLIIYTNAGTDPYSNGSPSIMINENQTNITSIIGSANYDVGHVLATNSGGLAGLGVFCNNTNKAEGVTGSGAPVGDPFDIDYVAHEIGHQFGCNHTFNNSCGGNRNNSTAVEPGSGSTIMAYAGICAPNVQSNSDAHFSYISIQEAIATTLNSASCAAVTPNGNFAPVVNAGLDYIIPRGTAFILKGSATDANGDALTYCWEQANNDISTQTPLQTSTTGPNFRSNPPISSPDRYMPRIEDVINNNLAPTWEVVPNVARTMDFALTVRDNSATNGGQTGRDDTLITTSSVGPFVVNTPNTALSWGTGTNQNVTWTVAGTDSNGINASFVDILLSTDGGFTYPILLASKVPNDGSEVVTMPNSTGDNRRIMVKGNNHIFYDISNTNFTITTSSATFALSYDGTIDGQNKSVCQGDNVAYDIKYETIGGFSANTSFSISGNPAGTIATFSPSNINSTGTVTMTLSNTTSVSPGLYTMVVTGTSGGTTKTVNLYLQIRNSAFTTMTLTSPTNDSFAQPTTVNLQWNNNTAATNYDVEVATDVDFNSTYLATNVTSTSYQLTGLLENTNYFWRVLPKNDGCQGAISSTYRFTTGQNSCSSVSSSDVPLTITSSGTPTVNSTLTISTVNNVIISDISVTLNISHTWISDLTVTLISPSGTQVQLFSNQCTNNDNAIATFTTNGSTLSCGTSPAISGNLAPAESFNSLLDTNSEGTWTLRVFDNTNQDGGAINSWSLNICSIPNTVLPCGTLTTTWNGSSWSNGYPVSNVAATINGNLTTTRDLEACSLDIIGNSNVIISSGNNFIIGNEVNVANTASLTLQNNANLVQIENTLNSGNATVYRETNPLKRLDYVLWSNPLTSSQTLKNFSPETLNNRFYSYNTQTNFYTVITNPVSTSFLLGNGYLIRMPDNHPTTPTIWNGEFTNGVPNNGNLEVNLSYFGANQKYNLIGNPYPSTINAETFLVNNNSDIDGVIYFFRKENNALGSMYATYTLGGATTASPTSPTPNGTIQVAQGFIVGAKNVATPKVTFTNSLRVNNNNNQFFRTSFGKSVYQPITMEKHRIWLNLTDDNGFFSQMMVGYMSNATIGLDDLIDGKSINDSPTFLSSLINNEEYTIQGRSLPFDNQDTVPLMFKTQVAGNYSISIGNIDGLFDGNQEIYLRDNLLNNVHNIKNTSYTFTSAIGEFDARFEIIYQNTILNTESFYSNNQVLISTENNHINVRSTIQLIQEITVFDLLGRNISSNINIENNDFVISKILPTKQTLIVKVLLSNGTTEIRKIQF